MNILEEANRVTGVRGKEYEHPIVDFKCTADMWSAILTRLNGTHVHVSPEIVAIMMAALKLSRLTTNATHRDSIVDTAGYMRCLEMIHEVQNDTD